MQAILGVIFHFFGGFASGSFYIPYKKVKGWAWESYWIVGGIFSWLIVPPLAAYLTIPNFSAIISATHGNILWLTYFFGILWGIGGLTYGLGVRYLGVSLGSSIILGLCMVLGSILPSIYFDFFPQAGKDTFTMFLHTDWGRMVLLGLLVCVFGIIICGKAGMMKEKEMKSGVTDPHGMEVKTEYKFGLGLFVGIVSGVLSACFNFGIEAGKPMADAANAIWKAANPAETGNFLFSNNVTYIIVLWGGLTTNFIWCMVLNARNKTFGDYTNAKTPLVKKLYFFCTGRYHLVFAVLFLRDGREQIGQWCQFVDFTHGLYHLNRQRMGACIKRMERCVKKNTDYGFGGNTNHHHFSTHCRLW
jgi:L-rhamnose-H+ transport protein